MLLYVPPGLLYKFYTLLFVRFLKSTLTTLSNNIHLLVCLMEVQFTFFELRAEPVYNLRNWNLWMCKF